MPENFWITLLGGFLAGGFGLFLFFIQRWKEKEDKEQNLIFRLYQLIERNIDGAEEDAISEKRRKWTEIKSISFLLKDTDLGRETYKFAQKKSQDSKDVDAVLEKITSKLNEELVKEIQADSSKKNESSGSQRP